MRYNCWNVNAELEMAEFQMKWKNIIHVCVSHFPPFSLQALTHVYAKNIATFVSQEAANRPVLLGLALKDCSVENMKSLKDMIKSCRVW